MRHDAELFTPVEDLVRLLSSARERTLELIGLVDESDLGRSQHAEFSPLRWHLGHVAAYEASWVLCKAAGRPSPRPEYDHLFDPTRNPKSERVHLPVCSDLLAFADQVRDETIEILSQASPDHPNPLLRDAFIGWLAYEHERQHQETMTALLQMIPMERLRQPASWQPPGEGSEPSSDLVAVPGGPFTLGTPGGGFAYDNERDPHEVDLAPFRIARAPTTEHAYLEFIEAAGYRKESLWTPDGWRWKVENDIVAPRGWSPTEAGGWIIRTLLTEREPRLGHPVVGVSAHEADAFARWAGRRLPSEAEWERAASWDERLGRARRFPWGPDLPTADRANTDLTAWGTRPITSAGRSPVGCDDMIGQVWEWTASPFAPYPGFRAFPYAGYSEAWFDGGHRVLRGGSWATAGHLCRASFRNWYQPHLREVHAGFRTASTDRTAS